jgi:hypothetical protein
VERYPQTVCYFAFDHDECNLAAMDESLDVWFKREVLAHEGALVRFLLRMSPNRQEVHSLRRDTYVGEYEAAVKSRLLAPKSFLYCQRA